MKTNNKIKSVIFNGEDGDTLTIEYDNVGDPYYDGIRIQYYSGDVNMYSPHMFLQQNEIKKLSDFLITLLGK